MITEHDGQVQDQGERLGGRLVRTLHAWADEHGAETEASVQLGYLFMPPP
jgi:hypothetical protein